MVSGTMSYTNLNSPDVKVELPDEAKNAKELAVPQLPQK